jgi:hypothetical protein
MTRKSAKNPVRIANVALPFAKSGAETVPLLGWRSGRDRAKRQFIWSQALLIDAFINSLVLFLVSECNNICAVCSLEV